MSETFDVIVGGAGLAGLTAAATAAQSGRRVLVLDARSPGGRARTDERRGFLFNQGAHALYRGGRAEQVLADLGIPPPSGNKPTLKNWGVAGDVVSRLPFNPGGAVRSKLVTTTGKAQLGRFLAGIPTLDSTSLADRSAEAWISGLGHRDDATDDPPHPGPHRQLRRRPRRHQRRRRRRAAPPGGAQGRPLPRWRVEGAGRRPRRPGDGRRRRAADRRPDRRRRAGRAGIDVHLGDGTVVAAPAVVLATGGPAATASVLREPPRWGLVGPAATAACLDLGLRSAPEKTTLFGVGEPLYLSTHTGAADLAPPGRALVHLMRYGARDAETDRADLWAHARLAGITEVDVVEQRFLARMVTIPAVPVPGAGLAGRPSIDAVGVPGVYLAGDWVGPEGLLADAALASGQAAGRAAAAYADLQAPVRA